MSTNTCPSLRKAVPSAGNCWFCSAARVSALDFVPLPHSKQGDRRVLLDRGFLPQELRSEPRTGGPAAIIGNLHWPDEYDRLFTPDPEGELWFARRVPEMAAELGTEPVLIVARESVPPVEGVQPWPVDASGIPNNHLQYAITWLALAAAWTGMTAFWLWRISRGHQS